MDLLKETAHRPWPVPDAPWVMAQTWHDLLFAHWPVPLSSIRSLVPDQLEIDTFDGQAWLGIVPFGMSGIRLRGLPPIPFTSRFPELNVRTYVTVEQKPGVFFFSLDAANLLAVTAAKALFHLPYYHAAMQVEITEGRVEYRSKRYGTKKAEFLGSYHPISEPYHTEEGSLEHWLTSRYCLYTQHASQLYRCDIHHLPWPLQTATAEIPVNSMADVHGIQLPPTTPLYHFSKRLDVIVWPLQKVSDNK